MSQRSAFCLSRYPLEILALVVAPFIVAGCGNIVDPVAAPLRQAQLGRALPASTAALRFLRFALPVDLTPNGAMALLEDAASPQGDLHAYDTRTGALRLITQLGSPQFDLATGISANGRISALAGVPAYAGLWSHDGGWMDLGSFYHEGCGGSGTGGAWDISANGSVVVGLVWRLCATEAFRWTDASGAGVMTRLQVLGRSFPGSRQPPNNRATVVSDDGQVAAGFAANGIVDRYPAVWRADATGFLLPRPAGSPEGAPGEVLSISADGQMVAGIWNLDGFYWTAATGSVALGRLPNSLPFDSVYPNAIAADGALIFGGIGDPFFSIPAAFVWTPGSGMRALVDVLAANGITVPGNFILTNVVAASADGSVLLGVAYDELFRQISFIVQLPASAYGQ